MTDHEVHPDGCDCQDCVEFKSLPNGAVKGYLVRITRGARPVQFLYHKSDDGNWHYFVCREPTFPLIVVKGVPSEDSFADLLRRTKPHLDHLRPTSYTDNSSKPPSCTIQ